MFRYIVLHPDGRIAAQASSKNCRYDPSTEVQMLSANCRIIVNNQELVLNAKTGETKLVAIRSPKPKIG